MISDDDLYSLAVFLGSIAMVLIVLYHFFEVNSSEDSAFAEKASRSTPAQQPPAAGRQVSGAKRLE
ncbi:Oligosaccaryltransferase-domain-containing protein [Hypoxylon sp. FL0543]|nr:Oligosaccaryltransferase-domain-containing protein [Hypoxylon sp. FL0543]